MEEDIERCGMPVFRICVFHMSAKVASKKPALMREAMGVMLADCFHFQVDYITGDANMACYRTGGSRQGSSRYYLKAYNAAQNGDPYCCPRAEFTTSNPLTLLRWMEDKFGIPWKDVGAVDWENIPGLDCMVARILEWSHSIPMEIWEQATDPVDEYKVRISEGLLHSNQDVYMLPETDNDSHTPLLVHLTPTWMSNRQRREMRNPETVKASHDRRREAQRAKKRGDPAPEEGTPGKGSASQRIRPQARGSDLLNLPTRLKARAKVRASIRGPMKSRNAKVDGSMYPKRANLRKAKRATPRRASPRKALRKAPPRRASPRASTTARARARSEAA